MAIFNSKTICGSKILHFLTSETTHFFWGACEETVCDPRGRVHGLSNLRVADAGEGGIRRRICLKNAAVCCV